MPISSRGEIGVGGGSRGVGGIRGKGGKNVNPVYKSGDLATPKSNVKVINRMSPMELAQARAKAEKIAISQEKSMAAKKQASIAQKKKGAASSMDTKLAKAAARQAARNK